MKIRSNKTPVNPEVALQQVEEAIRVRAHELYEERGRQDGHDLEDWLRAENEILSRKTRSIAA